MAPLASSRVRAVPPRSLAFLAVAPDAVVLGEAALHLNSQTLGRERLFVIHQVHAVGVNLQLSILVQHPKIGFGEIPVEDGLGGAGPQRLRRGCTPRRSRPWVSTVMR